jgi:hypothetical protein
MGQVPREPVGSVGEDCLVGPCPHVVTKASQGWAVQSSS